MIDHQLIELVKAGDRAAFKKMYEACIGYVYTIVRRYVSNESDYQDVIQEIFARVFVKIDTYNPQRGEFKFWLRSLSINQCMQNYRKGKSPALVVSLEALSETTSGDENLLDQLSMEEIEAMLEGMPEGYRKIFMLSILEEYSHKDIAELLGISPETSRSQLSRAKSWLRRNLFRNEQKMIAGGL